MGLLDGKVAIITGAGGGIGRCHALLFAREGAQVVVNDLGGGLAGDGGSQSMADQVVTEIKAAGGEAVASYGSVSSYEDANAIVQSAIDTYGRADVLVNNAGILRDKTLLKLEEQDWDLVLAVHLKGTFLCTQAFARHVKERGDGGGRVINTSSYAGLMGNFGQTNYSAAKAGIYGLTRTWALEFQRMGVTVNCLAPMAKTRMTTDIAVVTDDMKPEHVAPVALYLASDLAKDVTGRVFGIHGQQLLEYKMLMTDGVTKDGAEHWTPEEIHAKLDAIGAEAAPPAGAAPEAAAPLSDGQVIARAFQLMPKVFLPERAKGWSAVIQFDIAGGTPWTVTIKDGTCTAQEGMHGTATCTVSVAEATYAEVVTGKTKAEQAFMAGKIKASNLADMMKMGSAFDMKKARELAQAEAAKPATGGGEPAPSPGAGAGPSDAQVIARAFQLMPQVFLPERAKGWNAVLQFEIEGGTPWTITIKDGTCTTAEGKHGTATCTVNVSEATYAAVVQGKEKAEKAFMAGKIKASNLADMMKMGSAFDMKKARELAQSQGQSPAAPSPAKAPAPDRKPSAPGPEALVVRSFELLGEAFVPAGATGWKAVMRFDVEGTDSWTVAVADGACTISKGAEGEPTCVVTTRLVDYAKIVSGELRAEQAFMKGRIMATNLNDMMRFGRAFDLPSLKGKLLSVLPPAETTLNQALLNKVYAAPNPAWVKPEHVALFTDATEDSNAAYQGPEAIAPPMFSVRLLKDVLFRVIGDETLGADLLNLVHGEQDMEFLRPLSPWALCATRAEITKIEAKRTGELLGMEERLYAGGELAVRVKASMFIRNPSKPGGGEAKARPSEEAPRPELVFSDTTTVAEDQSQRYAKASLDTNPIHTDAEVAKLAGFKGVILHGLCTMSFAARAVVDHAAGGDPRRLARLAARFSKPVFMGDVLTTEAWRSDGKDDLAVYGFRVVNQDGVEVIKDGLAEVRS